jgi:hypothetical protein
MSDRARIKENPNLVKDFSNFAILNTDRSVLAQHKQKMAELNRKKQVETEINNLKSEVSDIKNMLGEILKAVSNEK